MPGLAPGIFIFAGVSKSAAKERSRTGTLQNLKIEFRQKTGTIPA
jgi:hypothetical protein